ncbi:MAG: single-stranded DNA-binding protein [Trebonia sp.]
MSQDNTITVRGYVTAEPKMWQRTPEQAPVATIRVGSTPRKLNRETGEWQDGETSYYSVKCWRKLAENVHGSLRKGDMVIVRGKVFTRSWLDDQQRVRMEVQIEADSVGHDLAFGWSRFNRGVHTPPSVLEGLANGEAVRHGMAPGPDLPGDSDGQFAEGQFAEGQFAEGQFTEDQFAEDEVSSDGGPGDPLSAQDNQAFAALTSDLDQPAEAATPF